MKNTDSAAKSEEKQREAGGWRDDSAIHEVAPRSERVARVANISEAWLIFARGTSDGGGGAGAGEKVAKRPKTGDEAARERVSLDSLPALMSWQDN